MKTASQRSPSPSKGTQAIDRALDIVRVVAQVQRSGATLSRIARISGLNITTTFRILRSLTENRMLRYDAAEQNYYIGPLLLGGVRE